jgi:hypothetical protein
MPKLMYHHEHTASIVILIEAQADQTYNNQVSQARQFHLSDSMRNVNKAMDAIETKYHSGERSTLQGTYVDQLVIPTFVGIWYVLLHTYLLIDIIRAKLQKLIRSPWVELFSCILHILGD